MICTFCVIAEWRVKYSLTLGSIVSLLGSDVVFGDSVPSP